MNRSAQVAQGSTRATIPIGEGRRGPLKLHFTKRAVEALPSDSAQTLLGLETAPLQDDAAEAD